MPPNTVALSDVVKNALTNPQLVKPPLPDAITSDGRYDPMNFDPSHSALHSMLVETFSKDSYDASNMFIDINMTPESRILELSNLTYTDSEVISAVKMVFNEPHTRNIPTGGSPSFGSFFSFRRQTEKVRTAVGAIITNQMLMTEEGARFFAMQISSMASSMQRWAENYLMRILVNAKQFLIDAYGENANSFQQSISEFYDMQADECARLQKSPGDFAQHVKRTASNMRKKYNLKVPAQVIGPSGFTAYLDIQPKNNVDNRTDAKLVSPTGVASLHDGIILDGTLGGLEVIESRDPLNRNGHSDVYNNHLYRVFEFGGYVRLYVDPQHLTREGLANFSRTYYDVMIYDEVEDTRKKISLIEVLNNTQIFKADGTPKLVNFGTGPNNSGTPGNPNGDQDDYLNNDYDIDASTLDGQRTLKTQNNCFSGIDNTGKYFAAEDFGSISPQFLSSATVEKVGQSIAAKLFTSDAERAAVDILLDPNSDQVTIDGAKNTLGSAISRFNSIKLGNVEFKDIVNRVVGARPNQAQMNAPAFMAAHAKAPTGAKAAFQVDSDSPVGILDVSGVFYSGPAETPKGTAIPTSVMVRRFLGSKTAPAFDYLMKRVKRGDIADVKKISQAVEAAMFESKNNPSAVYDAKAEGAQESARLHAVPERNLAARIAQIAIGAHFSPTARSNTTNLNKALPENFPDFSSLNANDPNSSKKAAEMLNALGAQEKAMGLANADGSDDDVYRFFKSSKVPESHRKSSALGRQATLSSVNDCRCKDTLRCMQEVASYASSLSASSSSSTDHDDLPTVTVTSQGVKLSSHFGENTSLNRNSNISRFAESFAESAALGASATEEQNRAYPANVNVVPRGNADDDIDDEWINARYGDSKPKVNVTTETFGVPSNNNANITNARYGGLRMNGNVTFDQRMEQIRGIADPADRLGAAIFVSLPVTRQQLISLVMKDIWIGYDGLLLRPTQRVLGMSVIVAFLQQAGVYAIGNVMFDSYKDSKHFTFCELVAGQGYLLVNPEVVTVMENAAVVSAIGGRNTRFILDKDEFKNIHSRKQLMRKRYEENEAYPSIIANVIPSTEDLPKHLSITGASIYTESLEFNNTAGNKKLSMSNTSVLVQTYMIGSVFNKRAKSAKLRSGHVYNQDADAFANTICMPEHHLRMNPTSRAFDIEVEGSNALSPIGCKPGWRRLVNRQRPFFG